MSTYYSRTWSWSQHGPEHLSAFTYRMCLTMSLQFYFSHFLASLIKNYSVTFTPSNMREHHRVLRCLKIGIQRNFKFQLSIPVVSIALAFVMPIFPLFYPIPLESVF